ncbi:hypothetical protein PQC31_gp19 [Pseudomonas phage Iggy]|uniref:Uncharacterized protein n=2 Tax=Viruses TaxID=10239 RepID=A0A7S5AYU6_9CAUD|nr:hypothetical protein PQC31_gp19 [Pseudomonas phage Iggy]QEA09740.1 hypothetical protein [Pseudomonas phage Iggy]WPK40866.1 hypothetical protein Knedl_CDS0084 [Pseudomonas phage Knedl]
MTEKLKDALSKLDPENNAHWTQTGEPALAIVNAFSGAKYTREDVVRADPEFSRDKARQAATTATEPGTDNSTESTPAPEQAAEPTNVVTTTAQPTQAQPETEADEGVKEENPTAVLEGHLESAHARIAELMDMRSKVEAEIRQVQDYVYKAESELSRMRGTTNSQSVITAYLMAQRKHTEMRIQNAPELKELARMGAELAKRLGVSPLDDALNKRKRIPGSK